jgi:hypothetical protein
MSGVGIAETAVFLGFHSVRVGFLVLGCVVVPLLAVRAGKSNFGSQRVHPA